MPAGSRFTYFWLPKGSVDFTPPTEPDTPANALAWRGEPLTWRGEILTWR